ncbi:pentatricopeptide repeat protein [Pseudohyphozyma bogoriensis]|nr:pentatricopeptide repeat protein [Pseudohyphozyma bogoriensis]
MSTTRGSDSFEGTSTNPPDFAAPLHADSKESVPSDEAASASGGAQRAPPSRKVTLDDNTYPPGGSGSPRMDSQEVDPGSVPLKKRVTSLFVPERKVTREPTFKESMMAVVKASWLNVLLVFIPPSSPSQNFLDTLGNAVELIVAIIALIKCEIRVVQSSLLGSILSNLLLVLGMCFFAGGVKFSEQGFKDTAAQLNSSLLVIAVIAILIPAGYNAAFNSSESDATEVNAILKMSRGIAIILLFIYGAYLIFQLFTHQHLYVDVGRDQPEINADGRQLWGDHRALRAAKSVRKPRVLQEETGEEEEEEEEIPQLSLWAALILLVIVTVLVAVTAEFLVSSINGLTDQHPEISVEWVGLILLPIVGNAAEHVTAVSVSVHDKIDLSMGVAVGSSIQIALFVRWALQLARGLHSDEYGIFARVMRPLTDMSAVVYIIIAVAFWFYPSGEATEGVRSLTEAELEGVYLGLMAAKPEELALPEALPSPSTGLLADPNSAVNNREGRIARLKELEERLESFGEGEVDEEGGKVRAETGVVKVESTSEAIAVGAYASEGRRVLEKLVNVLGSSIPDEDSKRLVPLGMVVKSEWTDLLVDCAESGDSEGVLKGLSLFQRTTPITDGKIVTDIMEVYARPGRHQPREALSLAAYARELHPDLALQHLYSLESAGHTPLLTTYSAIIRSLLSPSSPPHLVARGWDLYAHVRLVSHPTPSADLYATMIAACARGSHPSPERAVDLFIEMTEDNNIPPTRDAYNALIRACAMKGTQEYYFEALRYMKQMLDANIAPSRRTFHAVLEGARRHGDLARARWMLVKMMAFGGEASPSQSTLGLVFQTYAAFKLEKKGRRGDRRKLVEVDSKAESAGGAASATSSASPATTTDEPTLLDATEDLSARSIIKLLGESSLVYPGPLPQTAEKLLNEARNLMAQCFDLSLLNSTSTSPPAPFNSAAFPSLVPDAFLLNSYLTLLASHAPFDTTYEFFKLAYAGSGIEKNRHTYEIMISRCETAKNRAMGTQIAKEVFDEWKRWSDMAVSLEKAVELKTKEELESEELDPEAEAVGAAKRESRQSGASVSTMWASMIRVLARNYQSQDALALLQKFIARYPPSHLVTHATALKDASNLLPAAPTSIRLSSPLFPETTAAHSSRPPFITWDQLKVLHLRLANVEDVAGLKVLKGITQSYEGNLAKAKAIEAGDVAKLRKEKAHALVD